MSLKAAKVLAIIHAIWAAFAFILCLILAYLDIRDLNRTIYGNGPIVLYAVILFLLAVFLAAAIVSIVLLRKPKRIYQKTGAIILLVVSILTVEPIGFVGGLLALMTLKNSVRAC